MSLLQTIRFIIDHPLGRRQKLASIGRFLRWQIAERILHAPVVVDYVNSTSLVISRGMTGATGNYYVGLHEFEDMAFVAHVLRAGDTFIDVGANVGSYSVLAAACGARVHAFEPVKKTYEALRRNTKINDFEELITTHRLGVSDVAATLTFTTEHDTTNHVTTAGELGESIDVVPLDDMFRPDRDYVMKIDVEGLESRVVSGAERLLASGRVIALVVELNGSGKRYGVDDASVHDRLVGLGYEPRRYAPEVRSLSPGDRGTTGNTIYVREPQASQRIREGATLSVLGVSV